MSRIPLAWGNGTFDVLLDLSTMEFLKYASEEDAVIVHNRYGGRALYTSMSGRTGSGWVAQTPGLRKVDTYRVDIIPKDRHKWAPDISQKAEAIPGFNVVVPIEGGSNGTISLEWPVVIIKNGPPEQIYMVHPEAIRDVIMGTDDEFENRDYSFPLILSPESQLQDIQYVVRIPPRAEDIPRYSYVVVLSTLYHSQLCFQAPEEMKWHQFWGPLGLYQVGNHFYKVVHNQALARYAPEELSTLEGIQRVAPANVRMLSPTLYIQDRTSQLFAVGRCIVNGKEIAAATEVSLQAALSAFSGQISAVHTLVAQAIAEKSRQEANQIGGETRIITIHN